MTVRSVLMVSSAPTPYQALRLISPLTDRRLTYLRTWIESAGDRIR
jgi:hypothetical protein